jgi:hypothetical protein
MAAAILDVRPAPVTGPAKDAKTDLIRLFALDRLSVGRKALACHLRREADGRLAGIWAPDIGVSPRH